MRENGSTWNILQMLSRDSQEIAELLQSCKSIHSADLFQMMQGFSTVGEKFLFAV